MADNRHVHNTAPYALVVSGAGVRVLGNSTREIDITEPRAQKYLSSGDLILVNQADDDEPLRAQSSSKKTSKTTDSTNGE